jgi:hypothetical protein
VDVIRGIIRSECYSKKVIHDPDMRFKIEQHPPSTGTAMVSWALLCLALATFAPCVLLPEWRAFQQADAHRQTQQHRIAGMKAALERARHNLDALGNDPTVISRMAQRDLRFRDRSETAIRVSAGWSPTSVEPQPTFQPRPAVPPPLVTDITSRLPVLNYDRVFCDEETRLIIMCMSVALMMLGLCLSCRRHPATSEPDS